MYLTASHVYIEGKLYARLVEGDNIGFDSESALAILGFWNWLESCGFSDVISKISPSSEFMLCTFAKEAIRCMKFLETGIAPIPYQTDDLQILLMPSFLGTDFAFFRFLRENAGSAVVLAKIDQFVEDVFKKVFSDDNHHVIISTDRVHHDGTEKLPSLLAHENQIGAQFRLQLCNLNLFLSLSSYSIKNPRSK